MSQPNPNSATKSNLDPTSWLTGFVDLLLECPTLQTSGGRYSLRLLLPTELRDNVSNQNETSSRVAVTALAHACATYQEGGVSELIERLRFFDGNTIPLQAVETFLRDNPIPDPLNFPKEIEREVREREERLRARLDKDRDRLLEDRLKSFAPGSRRKELSEVKQLIQTQLEKTDTGGYVIITGDAGQGKTSLVAKLITETYPDAAYHFIPFSPTLEHQVTLLQSLLAVLTLNNSFLSDLWTETTNRSSLAGTFSNILEKISQHRKKTVVFIDGLDQIKPDAGASERDLDFLPLKLPTGIVIVLSSRPNETLQPLRLRCEKQLYHLPPLSKTDFSLVLAHRGVSLNDNQLEQLHEAVEGNALDLDFAALELQKLGNVEITNLLERISANPKNALFDQAIARLRQNRSEWENWLRPVLGYLLATVETESLNEDQLSDITGLSIEAVSLTLEKLSGLIGVTDQKGRPAYYLYHLKLIDYLSAKNEKPGQRVFNSREILHFHSELARWCEKDGAELWQDSLKPEIQNRREYARNHYITPGRFSV